MLSETPSQQIVLKIVAVLVCMSSNSMLLGQGVVPPPSNEEVGINIDRFIGSPLQSHPEVSHGAIIKRTILTHGDPATLGEPRAVLQYARN